MSALGAQENDLSVGEPAAELLHSKGLKLPTDGIEIIQAFSSTSQAFLRISGNEIKDDDLSQSLSHLICSSEVIFKPKLARGSHYVVRCSSGIALKVFEVEAHRPRDFAEYTTLQYLAEHKSDFPCPRPHGLLLSDGHAYMFMTDMQGSTLEAVWSGLSQPQKLVISTGLDDLLRELHSHVLPPGRALGDVGGEGCKDMRRTIRRAGHTIHNLPQFQTFMYGSPRDGDRVYIQALQQSTPAPTPQRIVLIHGDIRPANLIVNLQPDGEYEVTGIIDWEMAGFYPEAVECIRATNNLSFLTEDDWFLYLPSCASPRFHWQDWLLDHAWGRFITS